MDNNYSAVETFCPNEETRIPISGKEIFTCCVRFSSVFCPLVEKVGRPQIIVLHDFSLPYTTRSTCTSKLFRPT